ncbi:MAG: methyl-accepting chemotaxis protein [Selenomonadaceae bacterium]|nr:methyl-accepting chemotaxis protein [Selenomonadaceae bacterium]
MGIRQKFFVLAGLVGLLLAIVSVVGYYTANSNLEDSVEHELTVTVGREGADLNGWLMEKGASATYEANLMTAFNGDMARIKTTEALALASSDKEILDINVGLEDGYFASYYTGDGTARLDPRTRPWYNQAKSAGKTEYTEAYVDRNTKKLVVSVVSPFTANGQFLGVICTDIGLDVLNEWVKNAKYRGEEGSAIIFDPKGQVLASAGPEEPMSSARDVDGIGSHVDEMLQKDNGFFFYESKEGAMVFGYTKIPTTGWVFGLSVPYDFVFSSVKTMRFTYIILTLVGVIFIVFLCIQFSGRITGPIIELEQRATELSNGNLRIEDAVVRSTDEIGSLTKAFNTMSTNLRNLISKMATTAEQVAASSEELTANAQQSADASVHVAETVSEVTGNVDQQLQDIDGAKESVDAVYKDMAEMMQKAKEVMTASQQTSDAAKKGSELMEDAVAKMGNIEQSVMASAQVVKTLGENSQQIGQIVEAISSIAEQTNLLSLNAAIEAARAGEQGRGFAVVADEVRKLAAESQQSAEQIKARIASIQQDTAQAVESMNNGTAEVAHGTKAIRDVGVQFEDILSKVDGINQQMEEINQSVQTVTVGAERIVAAVDSIDSVSRKTADHTQTISSATEEQSASNEEIAAASHALATLAGDMQEAVGQFKL